MKRSHKIAYFLIATVISLMAFNFASATVGGPNYISAIAYDQNRNSILYTITDGGGRGCPPIVHKYNLETLQNTTPISCEDFFNTYSYNQQQEYEEAVSELYRDLPYVGSVSLDKNHIKISAQFVSEDKLGEEWVVARKFIATITQDGKKISEIEFGGCDIEQPNIFEGYMVPNSDIMIMLISNKRDCFEGGYVGEDIKVIKGIKYYDTNIVRGYKTSSATEPNMANVIVSVKDNSSQGLINKDRIILVIVLLLGVILGYFLRKNKKLAIVLILSSLIIPSVQAQTVSIKNVGFVPGNIWFSKTPFFAGEPVRIYTVVFNGTDNDLKGVVEFYDQGSLIGKSDFTSAGGNRVRDVWLDWTPTKGEHQITVKIADAKISKAGQAEQTIVLENSQAKTESIKTDIDTDKDGIGNDSDDDDDGDSLSDTKEKEIGTDPLKADSDGDGFNDGAEVSSGSDPLKSNSQSTSQSAVVNNALNVLPESVKKAIPASVVESVQEVDKKTSSYLDTQAKKIDQKIQEIKKDIENSKQSKKISDIINNGQSSSSEIANAKAVGPLTYAYLVLLTILKYILKTRIVFYILAVILAYYILRYIYRKLFRRY